MCGADRLEQILDLGEQPSADTFPRCGRLERPEPSWPLRVHVCTDCWLVQLGDEGPDEGAAPHRLGPTSETARSHGRGLADYAARTAGPAPSPRVLEFASHGGYLQPFFRQLGLETTILERDPRLVRRALSEGYAIEAARMEERADSPATWQGEADLEVDNYLLAHLRRPEPFLRLIAGTLRPGGHAVLEFDHVRPLIEMGRFDSIRHGHFAYLSLLALVPALRRAGLFVSDASEQSVYGGALRITVEGSAGHGPGDAPSAARILADERRSGLDRIGAYRDFAAGVVRAKSDLLAFIRGARADGRTVAAYGAPSRGNTLLNTCGIGRDLISFTVDVSPAKQGRCLPGSRIPILPPSRLVEERPDYVLVLAWDLIDEIAAQLRAVTDHGTRLLVPFPSARVIG